MMGFFMRNQSSLSLEKTRWFIVLITLISLQSTGAIFCYEAIEDDEVTRYTSPYAVPVNIFIAVDGIYITPAYGVEIIQNNSEMLKILSSGQAPRLKEPPTESATKIMLALTQIRKLYVLDNIIIATLVQDQKQVLSSSMPDNTDNRPPITNAVLDEVERNIQKDNPLQAIYIPPEPDKKLMTDLTSMKLALQEPLRDSPLTPSVPSYKVLAEIYSPSFHNPVSESIKSVPADLEIWIQGITCDCIDETAGGIGVDNGAFNVCEQCISLIDKRFSAIIERWQSLAGLSVKPLLIADKRELLQLLLAHSCSISLPDDGECSTETAYLQPISLLDQLLFAEIMPETTPSLSAWRPSILYRTNRQHKKLAKQLGGDHQYNTPSPFYVYSNEKLDIELYKAICREVKRTNRDQDEMQDTYREEKISLFLKLNQWITKYKEKFPCLSEKDIYTLCDLIYELVLFDYDDIARRVIERYGFDFKIFRKYIHITRGKVSVDAGVMEDSYTGMDVDVDMDKLIDKGDNLLFLAIKKNKLNLLYYLLSFGDNAGDELLVRFKDIDTVFHYACKEASADCLKILLEQGAKLLGSGLLAELLEKLDAGGRRCLHWAVDRKNYEMCVQLLRYNADCNAQTAKERFTPLHLAAKNNLLEIVELLLKQPAIAPDLKSGSNKAAYTETKNIRIKSLINNSIRKIKRKKQKEDVDCIAEDICHIDLKRKSKEESNAEVPFKKRKVKVGWKNYEPEENLQSLFYLKDLVNVEAIDSDDRRKHYYCPPVLCVNAYKKLAYIIDRKQMPVTVFEKELLDKIDRNIQVLYGKLYDNLSISSVSDETILKTPGSLISFSSQHTELEEISLAFKQDGGLHKKINDGKDMNCGESISAFMPDEVDISEDMLCYFISSIDNILKSPVKGFEKYAISHHDIINHLIAMYPDIIITIVGGAIRDTLQYIFTHHCPMEEGGLDTDIDIQTSLTEEQITNAFDQLLQERNATECERANCFIKRDSGYVGFGYPDNTAKLDTFNAGKLFYAVRNCSFTINSNFCIYRPGKTSVLYIKSPMSFDDVFTKTIRFRENWFDASLTSTKVPGMILRALDFLRRGYILPEDNGMTVYMLLRALHQAFEEIECLDRSWLLDFIKTTKNDSPLKDKILQGQLLNEYPSIYNLFLYLMRLGHFSCLSLDGLVSSSGNILVAAERFMQKKCSNPDISYKLIAAFHGIMAKPQYLPLKKAFAKDIQKLHQLLYAIQLGMSNTSGLPVPASIMLAEAALASCPEKTDSLPYDELFDGVCELKKMFSNQGLSSGMYCLLYEKMNEQFCDQGLELTFQGLEQLINRSLPFDKSYPFILDSLSNAMKAIGIKN
ncbi:ankyrin repeat domain-containing protein [Endozoicomonas sp. Mp262]|uniref:ankyrin repeat domain-containing protein n=1 Tax=Endozoicomonas sp. Mp262 TaxID=2919499 RepID=UPI0021DA4BB4